MPKELLTAMLEQVPRLIGGHGPPACRRIDERPITTHRIGVDCGRVPAVVSMAAAGAMRFHAPPLVFGAVFGARTRTSGGHEPITCQGRST